MGSKFSIFDIVNKPIYHIWVTKSGLVVRRIGKVAPGQNSYNWKCQKQKYSKIDTVNKPFCVILFPFPEIQRCQENYQEFTVNNRNLGSILEIQGQYQKFRVNIRNFLSNLEFQCQFQKLRNQMDALTSTESDYLQVLESFWAYS